MTMISKKEALVKAWNKGFLKYKCHPIQTQMYDLFYSSAKNSILVWLLARQSGKSFLLGILALEQACKNPNSIIKIVTDTKLHIKSILEPIFNQLLEDCPEELKPDYKTQTYTYYFPNGSQIQLAGTDNKHYQKLRGQKADLILVDEAGFCNNLEDVIKSVLIPTTTHTGGRIVLATTPPESNDHEFFPFMEEAELKGLFTKKTIHDNPLLSKQDVERIINAMGGVTSERFRREYLCEIIKDSSTSVIPEFNDDLIAEIVKEWPTPPFYDSYEAMDLGYKDLTVVLFGYYDFRADKTVILDEIIFNFNERDNNLPLLTKLIEQKEEVLWRNPLSYEVRPPYLRVSDINYIVTTEILRASHNKINFIATKKDDKDSAINTLRVLLQNKKIIIHPRCVTLIRHLKNVKYKSKNDKSTFARSPDDGHYDAVDALIYLIRNIIFTKNPYPSNYGVNKQDLYINNPTNYYKNDQAEVFKRIFNVRKR